MTKGLQNFKKKQPEGAVFLRYLLQHSETGNRNGKFYISV